jgi:signal peptidase I
MRVQVEPSSAGLNAFWDNVKTILYALLLAMVIRFAIAQPFRIPSGSMQPTLLVGDYIVVTKWSYGYSRFSLAPLHFGPSGRIFGQEPDRGDIVVFRPGNAPDKDFVKRLIGMPGDKIQVIDSVLHINGEPVKRERLGKRLFTEQTGEQVELEAYAETLPNGVSYTTFDRYDGQGDHTQVYEVPEGHYLMLGDDRDNSSDSRYEMGGFGYVPFDHLVGKARFVFVSFDETTSLFKPWTLITGFRGERFVHGVR